MADAEIAITRPLSNPNFFEDTFSDVKSKVDYVYNLHSSRCFVKAAGPSSVLLVFIPSDCNHVNPETSQGSDRLANEIAVLMFECAREMNLSKRPQVRVFTPHSSDLADASHGPATLHLSKEMQLISKMYESSYVKGVYAWLLSGQNVDDVAIARAVHACKQTAVELDLTPFFRTVDEKGASSQ
jgi:hypothetical protein